MTIPMTPDVPRLREIRAKYRRAIDGGHPASIDKEFFDLLDALLADAPPDGAAEREALVPAPKWFGYRTTPAPTEAPAADWRSAHDAWWCGADSKYREQHGVAFEAGYRAGMFAARPAAVTDAMVEAACRIDRRWASWARDDEERTAALRVEVRDMLAAALAARGPACRRWALRMGDPITRPAPAPRMRIVPEVADTAMQHAGADAIDWQDKDKSPQKIFRLGWPAMLDAAPSAGKVSVRTARALASDLYILMSLGEPPNVTLDEAIATVIAHRLGLTVAPAADTAREREGG